MTLPKVKLYQSILQVIILKIMRMGSRKKNHSKIILASWDDWNTSNAVFEQILITSISFNGNYAKIWENDLFGREIIIINWYFAICTQVWQRLSWPKSNQRDDGNTSSNMPLSRFFMTIYIKPLEEFNVSSKCILSSCK